MFDLVNNTASDADMIRKLVQEQIEIAGVEMKYYPIDTFKGYTHDKSFAGEDMNFKFGDPIICKAILTTPPEVTRIFQAMGLNTTDSMSLSFEKESVVSLIGRRPMPRDRIVLIYNDSNYEITNILEQPPETVCETFVIQVQAQKIIESYEDRELLFTDFLTPSGVLGFSAIPISAQDAVINTLHITSESGAIESATSALGSGFGHSDDDVFGRW